MGTWSLRKLAEGHSVPPPHNALGLAELPGSPQLPRLLLCDTCLMACLSFPLLNGDGQGGEGAMGGKHQACAQLRVKCSANLSYQSGGKSENIPEAAGIPTISIKRWQTVPFSKKQERAGPRYMTMPCSWCQNPLHRHHRVGPKGMMWSLSCR